MNGTLWGVMGFLIALGLVLAIFIQRHRSVGNWLNLIVDLGCMAALALAAIAGVVKLSENSIQYFGLAPEAVCVGFTAVLARLMLAMKVRHESTRTLDATDRT